LASEDGFQGLIKGCEYLNLEHSSLIVNGEKKHQGTSFERMLNVLYDRAENHVEKLHQEKTKKRVNGIGENFSESKILNEEGRLKKLESYKKEKAKKNTRKAKKEKEEEEEKEEEAENAEKGPKKKLIGQILKRSRIRISKEKQIILKKQAKPQIRAKKP